MLHFSNRMQLVVLNITAAQHIFIYQLLQLQHSSSFVAANIAEVIGAATAHGQSFGIVVLLNVYFIISAVSIIFNPEVNGIQQFIVIDHFHISA